MRKYHHAVHEQWCIFIAITTSWTSQVIVRDAVVAQPKEEFYNEIQSLSSTHSRDIDEIKERLRLIEVSFSKTDV